MGSLMMHLWLVAALSVSLCSAAPVSGSLEVLIRSPISVRRGHTTTLPCWLNPPQSAAGFEVNWYRGQYSSPVMFYPAKKFENASQEASYVGRVSFGLKDVASTGLTAGDVSLKLEKATIKDAGHYTCYVSSEQGYDKASVSLSVTGEYIGRGENTQNQEMIFNFLLSFTINVSSSFLKEMGTPPLMSAVWVEYNMVNMSCESEGWHPEPNLRWWDKKQDLTPKSLKYSKDSSGLLSVHSWLLVSGAAEVSCSVGLSDEEPKEATVRLDNFPQTESTFSSAGWVAFALLLTAMLVLLGLGLYKWREKKAKSDNDQADGMNEENQKLLPKASQSTIPSEVHECYVNVTLEETNNKYLTIRGGKLRDANIYFPDGDKVTCLTAIRGTNGFSSGRHYWEVSLGTTNEEVGLKKSWWVGVTSAVIPQNSEFPPTTSDGFWFLSSSPDTTDSFQFNTEPNVSLPVYSRPQRVGVFLNYDDGELSFYNVKEGRLIGSLTANFTGDIFPFFNPGKGDKAVMEILQREEQGQSCEMGNSADPPVLEAAS